jgi:hypothetical protein
LPTQGRSWGGAGAMQRPRYELGAQQTVMGPVGETSPVGADVLGVHDPTSSSVQPTSQKLMGAVCDTNDSLPPPTVSVACSVPDEQLFTPLNTSTPQGGELQTQEPPVAAPQVQAVHPRVSATIPS